MIQLCALASLRLGENESSHSGGGSRKGAKTQRSQREDPGYGWTKFSKTISLFHIFRRRRSVKGRPMLFLLRLTLAIWLFLFIAPASREQGDYVRASVRSVKGIARIYVSTQPGVFTPKRNDPLEPGNTIETGWNGRVVISLSDGGQITVLPNSRVVLKTFIVPHSARELLEILMGRVLVKIRHVGGKPNPYRLNSPTASIAVRGTEFIVDVLSGGETVVVVREGLVEVWSRNNPDNKRLVSPGGRVIVRPGGDISSAFPGPGSGLNGRSRFYGSLGEDYQRSVDGVAQNSNEVSPVFFPAFPDSHLDSLENPAYAAEFKNAEGRLLLLPSLSEPYLSGKDQPNFDYSVSPQLTFFTPIPGSRLVVGGGASAFAVRSRNVADNESTDHVSHYLQDLKMNALNVSLIAAYSFGDHGKTSVGLGVDRLLGDGNLLNESDYQLNKFYSASSEESKARFERTRLTFGFTRRFSDGKKLGLYFRQGITSSYQDGLYVDEYADESHPMTLSITLGKTNISNLSSEVGARFRAPLTRRLFYGIEGSYLYERINARRESVIGPTLGFSAEPTSAAKIDIPSELANKYLSRRARFGAGLGFALSSKILLDFDVTGGVFNNDRPLREPISSSFGISSYPSYPGSLRSAEGTFVSAHAAAQTNLWRNLLLSASSLTALRRDLHYAEVETFHRSSNGAPIYEIAYSTYKTEYEYKSWLSNVSLGWKSKPDLVAEYLYSTDHRYRDKSHSLRIRYTFNLGITGEK